MRKRRWDLRYRTRRDLSRIGRSAARGVEYSFMEDPIFDDDAEGIDRYPQQGGATDEFTEGPDTETEERDIELEG